LRSAATENPDARRGVVHQRLPAVTPHCGKVQATAANELARVRAGQRDAHVAVTQALGFP